MKTSEARSDIRQRNTTCRSPRPLTIYLAFGRRHNLKRRIVHVSEMLGWMSDARGDMMLARMRAPPMMAMLRNVAAARAGSASQGHGDDRILWPQGFEDRRCRHYSPSNRLVSILSLASAVCYRCHGPGISCGGGDLEQEEKWGTNAKGITREVEFAAGPSMSWCRSRYRLDSHSLRHHDRLLERLRSRLYISLPSLR